MIQKLNDDYKVKKKVKIDPDHEVIESKKAQKNE